MHTFIPIFFAAATGQINAQAETCPPPTAPNTCYSTSDCNHCRCLGPTLEQGNAPVRPSLCNGEFALTVAGFCWKAHQDGLEYAIDNEVLVRSSIFSPEINNLVEAHYETPHFQWNFGYKLGLTYNSPCDGWDIGILWTDYRGRAHSHDEADPTVGNVLIPLWTQFTGGLNAPIFASAIHTLWKLQLDLVDIELGREFWTSRYLTLRPFVGLRVSWIEQKFKIAHKGGSWTGVGTIPSLNNRVSLKNEFKGVGLRSGFNLEWNFGCGWSLYNNLAASIVYGRFNVDHSERNRTATVPFESQVLIDTKNHFHSARAMLDLELGVQWYTGFCDCKYIFTAMFGWEQHLFLNQNQLWRVQRKNAAPQIPLPEGIIALNNSGENVYEQRSGTLGTVGWTLTFKFDF